MAVPVALTVTQMIDEFLIEYDRVFAQAAQSYNDDEIVDFLNRAQEQLVTDLYNEKRTDLLGTLYDRATVATPGSLSSLGIPNGYFVSRANATAFPRGVMFFMDISVSATRTNLPAGSDVMLAEWIDKMSAMNFIKDLSNSQILFRKPKCYTEGDYLVILVDAFTNAPGNVYVQYVKYPLWLVKTTAVANTSTTTCELRQDLHRPLVTRAVYLAKEATDRLQPQKQTE